MYNLNQLGLQNCMKNTIGCYYILFIYLFNSHSNKHQYVKQPPINTVVLHGRVTIDGITRQQHIVYTQASTKSMLYIVNGI